MTPRAIVAIAIVAIVVIAAKLSPARRLLPDRRRRTNAHVRTRRDGSTYSVRLVFVCVRVAGHPRRGPCTCHSKVQGQGQGSKVER